ncbi:hypothetical protein PR003_g18647 [Phytophthora rubi]|uniref:Uncharacterized protein n=1 Tax=Phytophthora rubi TaxID=129364 RepID=A0A6A4DZ17_9STRA|nr:hypothetical protein PR002_g18072 [Phytophthora rubi]KAE9316736.1 hypothetical protein PR003_g18647 [Phytophthora rubi]
MWLNSRDLSADDDSATTRDGVWGFAASSQSASHGSIGASVSRALWNRMEPAEEEREEEALPSYLSYLQPAFRPAPTTLVPSAPQTPAFYTAKRGAPGLPMPMSTPPAPMPQTVTVAPEVGNVTRKSSELAQALEHLVLGSVQRHLGDATPDKTQARCRCSCDAMRSQMADMAVQVQALQNQVLELTKHSIPTAIEVGRVNVKTSSPCNGNWSANAPPFVPKQQQQQFKQQSQVPAPPPPLPATSVVDQATATVLSDRISTLEGRQSAFQSQLAQIAKVLGIPTGKPGKHSPVKHLVQTLRDEVDAKVQQTMAEARTDLTAEINAALGDIAAGKPAGGSQEALSSNVVLAALAGEHEASLARLSGSFEELLAEEARQRAALEARVRFQLAQQEEWLQQLEGAFGSPHDPEHEQEPRSKDSASQRSVDAKLAQLERKCDESRELYRRLSRLLPEAANSTLRMRPGEEEDEDEEDGLGWPGHMTPTLEQLAVEVSGPSSGPGWTLYAQGVGGLSTASV